MVEISFLPLGRLMLLISHDPKHGAIIKKATELLSVGATVCAICGATVALARAGLLDQRPHTSNGAGFLEMFCRPEFNSAVTYPISQSAIVSRV